MKLWYKLNEKNRIENWTTVPHHEYDMIEIEDETAITEISGIIDGQLTYIPYSEEEIAVKNEQKRLYELNMLRMRRDSECFSVINRGNIWYSRLTAEQMTQLNAWYNAWLDITETKTIPEKPEWLK